VGFALQLRYLAGERLQHMKTLEITTYTLPAYWASYLINGDASGLEEGEQALLDAFLRRKNLPAPVLLRRSVVQLAQ